MLVSCNSEDTSSVEEPFIISPFVFTTQFIRVFSIKPPQPSSPVVVDTEPEDAHSEQEWILITTRITNDCIGRERGRNVKFVVFAEY